ncbi:hypothetical protein D3C79_990870 [compost metagenome]
MDNSQSQAAAAGRAVAARVETHKGFKHALAGIGGNAGAIIFHPQAGAIAVQVQGNAQLVVAVAQGVIDQIIHRALHQAHIQRTVVTTRAVDLKRALRVDALHVLHIAV